jgi:Domain of unknown function (DUF4112)
MPKSTRWRASETEIVDDSYVRRQGEARPDAANDEFIEKIAWLMDRSIPIGGMRIGLDPVIGLIPGVGDALGGLISTVIIVQAHKAGVPKATLLRMVANVGIDAALGAVPLIGDLFDFAWKVNVRNLELYRSAMAGQQRASQDWGFLAMLILGVALIVLAPIVLVIWFLGALF